MRSANAPRAECYGNPFYMRLIQAGYLARITKWKLVIDVTTTSRMGQE